MNTTNVSFGATVPQLKGALEFIATHKDYIANAPKHVKKAKELLKKGDDILKPLAEKLPDYSNYNNPIYLAGNIHNFKPIFPFVK